MGCDAEGARPRVGRQEAGGGRWGPTGAGALVEAVRDGSGAEGVPGHRVREGGVELPGLVLVEEAEQGRGVARDEFPAAGEGLEEGVGVRAGLAEAIAAAELVRPALGRG